MNSKYAILLVNNCPQEYSGNKHALKLIHDICRKISYTSNRAANYILPWEDLKSLDRHLHVSIHAIIRTVKN